MQSAYTIQEVKSHFGKEPKVYVLKNEKVMIVSNHENVLIVERANGEKVPVERTNLIIE